MTDPSAEAHQWAALALSIVGVAIAVLGRRALRAAGTNVDRARPTTAIVTTGPYRFSRNLLYVGLTLLYLGLTSAFNTWVGRHFDGICDAIPRPLCPGDARAGGSGGVHHPASEAVPLFRDGLGVRWRASQRERPAPSAVHARPLSVREGPGRGRQQRHLHHAPSVRAAHDRSRGWVLADSSPLPADRLLRRRLDARGVRRAREKPGALPRHPPKGLLPARERIPAPAVSAFQLVQGGVGVWEAERLALARSGPEARVEAQRRTSRVEVRRTQVQPVSVL
ncbi:MAG: hypothetical protein DMD87_09295 [Candidatus Rokuibacteriota bacterium]|nr:MAG: hypothetical protein DMD87_09295 [Candidatus Rokubacteria bacterium]